MKPRLTILGALALLGACASPPRVVYHTLHDGRRADNWVLYRLTDTTIVVGVPAAKDGLTPAEGSRPSQPLSLEAATAKCESGVCTPAPVAVAAPIDDDGKILALAPKTRDLVTTYLAPTYWPNSLRLKLLSIEVHDHKLEAIAAVGSIAAGVGKMAATGGARDAKVADTDKRELLLPVILDLPVLKKLAVKDWMDLPGQPGWHVRAKFLDDPETEGFLPRDQAPSVHAAILTSTCRPMSIQISDRKLEEIDFLVSVADPDWLTPIPLPPIGAVAMHPLCGADVQNQKVVEVGVDQEAQSFFTQVQAVRTATAPAPKK
jgi:hypothetical protein